MNAVLHFLYGMLRSASRTRPLRLTRVVTLRKSKPLMRSLRRLRNLFAPLFLWLRDAIARLSPRQQRLLAGGGTLAFQALLVLILIVGVQIRKPAPDPVVETFISGTPGEQTSAPPPEILPELPIIDPANASTISHPTRSSPPQSVAHFSLESTLPSNLLGGIMGEIFGGSWHAPQNWNEVGPQKHPPQPW